MLPYMFTDKTLEEKYKNKEEELLKLVKEPVMDSQYLWNQTAEKYGKTMERVKRVLTSEGMKDYEINGILKNIDSFLCKCGRNEFHIALVGAIKAGKSTLINALLGYQYASTKVTPETAALTKFKKAEKNYVRILFYTEDEWENVWNSAKKAKAAVFLEEYDDLKAESQKEKWIGREEHQEFCDSKEKLKAEIERWTSSKSPEHYFVKEVEVGLEEFGLPEGVVLVDTPGLDDIVEYRSNITKSYIESANAVLVCVKADALTGQEMATIYGVFSNKRNNPELIYIIATQTDTLNRPVEDWGKQKQEWLKHLKGEGAYNSRELAEQNLIDVSAYFDILLKNYGSFSEDDEEIWDLNAILSKLRVKEEELSHDQNTYKRLLEQAHIDFLENKINREIVEKRKALIAKDIKNQYELCKGEILTFVRKKRKNQEQLLETSQKSQEEIECKYREIAIKCKEAEDDQKELESIINRFKKLADDKAKELEKAIKEAGRV